MTSPLSTLLAVFLLVCLALQAGATPLERRDAISDSVFCRTYTAQCRQACARRGKMALTMCGKTAILPQASDFRIMCRCNLSEDLSEQIHLAVLGAPVPLTTTVTTPRQTRTQTLPETSTLRVADARTVPFTASTTATEDSTSLSATVAATTATSTVQTESVETVSFLLNTPYTFSTTQTDTVYSPTVTLPSTTLTLPSPTTLTLSDATTTFFTTTTTTSTTQTLTIETNSPERRAATSAFCSYWRPACSIACAGVGSQVGSATCSRYLDLTNRFQLTCTCAGRAGNFQAAAFSALVVRNATPAIVTTTVAAGTTTTTTTSRTTTTTTTYTTTRSTPAATQTATTVRTLFDQLTSGTTTTTVTNTNLRTETTFTATTSTPVETELALQLVTATSTERIGITTELDASMPTTLTATTFTATVVSASPTETVTTTATTTVVRPRLVGEACDAPDIACQTGAVCVQGICALSVCTADNDYGYVTWDFPRPINNNDPFRYKSRVLVDRTRADCCTDCQQAPDFCALYTYDAPTQGCIFYNVERFTLGADNMRSWMNQCVIQPRTAQFSITTQPPQDRPRDFGIGGCGIVARIFNP